MNRLVHKRTLLLALCALFALASTTCQAIRPAQFAYDDIYFYQTPYFHGAQPDTRKAYASTLQVSYANGSARRGDNNRGKKTSILDLCGQQNLRFLIDGLQDNEVPSSVRPFFDDLKANDPDELLGLVGYTGKFEVDDVHVNFQMNFEKNFFMEVDLPIKRLKVDQITLVDASPVAQASQAAQASWEALKGNVDTILQAFNMSPLCNAFDNKVRVGDIRAMLGWQTSGSISAKSFTHYQFTTRLGIHLPIGDQVDTCHSFAVPIGYNGHFGIPFRFDLSVMTKYNIHLGAHLAATLFYDDSVWRRIRSDRRQSGKIKLRRRKVGEKMGPTFSTGAYILFDHFLKGASLLAGYSFNVQGARTWSTAKHPELDECVVRDDACLRGWDAHALHWLFEYDFRAHTYFMHRSWAPYLNLFYNYHVSGKNSYHTDTGGGSLGLEIGWKA